MALDLRGFFIDSPPQNQGVTQLSNTVQEIGRYNKETKYRQQKEAEADEWRKINLVQDLTDLSKHQTSSDVANAVGNQKASEILQKYTEAAKTMSGAELQAMISKEMSGVIGGMDAMKAELDVTDESLKLLKQQYPGLDMATLAKTVREDVLKRRMDNDLNFVNPMTVPPPGIDLSDQEYLADFMGGNKNLVTSIVDPKGAEAESVLMGKQGDYTKFEGKLPFWKTPTYDRTKFNEEGFYTGKEIPSFKVKSSVIPTDAMPSSNGKPFEVIDKDVYDRFAQDGNANLELIAATKKQYPNYSNFNPQEKEYAKRNVLLKQIQTYDQSQLHPTGNVRPQKINVNTEGKMSKAEVIANTPLDFSEYNKEGDSYDVTELAPGIKVTGLPTGDTFAAKKILYNPDTKKVTYTDVRGETKTQSFDTFRQNIATINTGVDLSFIDRLKVTPKPNNSSPNSAPKTDYTEVTSGTYNGNKIKIGKKNGKWYNIKTGQELK